MKQIVALLLLLVAAQTAFSQTRTPQFAGKLYPSDPVVLADSVNSLLSTGSNWAKEFALAQLVAVIVPQDGYERSGRTAAQAYAAVQGRNYRRIFVLAAAKNKTFKGAAIPSASVWQTPLGQLEVDTLVERVLQQFLPFVHTNDSAFDAEPSIEVQMPFIQKSFGEVKVVPILFGSMEFDELRALGTIIRKIYEVKTEPLRDPTLVVASSDMSEGNPESVATDRDWKTSQLVTSDNVDQIASLILTGTPPLSGSAPVLTTMFFAEQLGAGVRTLGYATSAGFTHDTTKVVGYGAFAFGKPFAPDPISAQDRKELLSDARAMLEASVRKATYQAPTPTSKRLQLPQGAFVTLMKGEEVRGCIGYRTNQQDLFQSVMQSAKFAASDNPLFAPIADSELSKIKIEISAVGDFHRVRKTDEITLGEDGLYIHYGDKSGLLLPGVARQYKWSLDEYLKQICAKADLDTSVFSKPEVELYRFTAEEFSE